MGHIEFLTLFSNRVFLLLYLIAMSIPHLPTGHMGSLLEKLQLMFTVCKKILDDK